MTLKKATLCLCASLMMSTGLTTIAAAEETTTEAKKQLWGQTWSGRINFGGFVTDGNSQKKAVTFDGFAKARDKKNRYKAGGEIRYAEDEGEETEDEYMAYIEYDRFISEKLFAGARASYKVDDIADLDSRIKIGPYIGYQFHESDPLNLSTRLGIDFIADEFENGDSEETAAASWGLDYDQKFFTDAIQVFYKHDLSVPFDDTEGFLYDGETGIRFPVAKILTGSAQIDFDWDNAPAPGVQEDDTTYSLKIGYEF